MNTSWYEIFGGYFLVISQIYICHVYIYIQQSDEQSLISKEKGGSLTLLDSTFIGHIARDVSLISVDFDCLSVTVLRCDHVQLRCCTGPTSEWDVWHVKHHYFTTLRVSAIKGVKWADNMSNGEWEPRSFESEMYLPREQLDEDIDWDNTQDID